MKRIQLSLLFFLIARLVLAGDEDSLKADHKVNLGLFPKQENTKLYRFGVSGFYRFFGTYTQMDERYLLDPASQSLTPTNNVFIGDDSQLPNLSINLSGRPTINTSWGFDLFAFQFIDGNVNQAYSQRVPRNTLPSVYDPLDGTRLGSSLNLLLGMNLYGSHSTQHGTFKMGFGGLQWVSLSDLTLASFRGYNRFTLFERNPWDPIGNEPDDRYSAYYSQGNINQDSRWGERAFQGFNFAASGLPGNFNVHLLYGKTDLNGGFLTIPNSSYGGKIQKMFGDGSFVALNSFNNLTWTDSLATDKIGFNIYTAEFNKTIKGIQLIAEAGAGQYFSPDHDFGWGELVNAKIRLPKEKTLIPIEIHAFRVSQNVVNNNAIYWNTSFEEATNNEIPAGNIGSSNVLQPFASSMAPIGAVTNNRQGINLNTEVKIKRLKLSVALGMAGELEGRSNQISLSHSVNRLTRSRMWRWNFPANVGPYNRYNVAYRSVFDLVQLKNDSLGGGVNPKRFSVIETQAKYQAKILHRDFYVFMLNRYSSVQKDWSPITVFNDKAYVRQYTNEIEAYYHLRKKLVLSSYLGYERAIANDETEVDDTSLKPRDQEGLGIGVGLDLSLGKNAGLYIRHRWFRFEDASYELDYFKGQETLVELKVFF